MSSGWIGVDLDGTLAFYDGWKGAGHIGEPIPLMVERVKRWLSDGYEVRIFTARVSHDGSNERIKEALQACAAIEAWTREVFGQTLEVTNQKDYGMIECWDDRAVQVRCNEGVPVGQSTRGLS